tara:strand:+ start:6045 stop:6518 length:474 start_codon:yes stop_codon:yes gene_type:complete
MKMSFKMKPGRGNSPKTGHGLPGALLQTKTQNAAASIDKKRKTGTTFKEDEADKRFATGAQGTGIVPGTALNPRTNETEPKSYEKKLVTQKNRDVSIMGGDGKIVKTAKYNSFNSKAIDALKKEYGKSKEDTQDSRKANTMLQNERAKRVGGFKGPN